MHNRQQGELCTYMRDAAAPLMVTAANNADAKVMMQLGARCCMQVNDPA